MNILKNKVSSYFEIKNLANKSNNKVAFSGLPTRNAVKLLPPAPPVIAVIGDSKTLNASAEIKIGIYETFLRFSHEKLIQNQITHSLKGAKIGEVYAPSSKDLKYTNRGILHGIHNLFRYLTAKKPKKDNHVDSFVMSIGSIFDFSVFKSAKKLFSSSDKLNLQDKENIKPHIKHSVKVARALSRVLDKITGFITPGNYSSLKDAQTKVSITSMATGKTGRVHTVGSLGLEGGISGLKDKTGGDFVSGLRKVDRYERGVFQVIPIIDKEKKVIKGFKIDLNKGNQPDLHCCDIKGLDFIGKKASEEIVKDKKYLDILDSQLSLGSERFAKYLSSEKVQQLKDKKKFSLMPSELAKFDGLVSTESYAKVLSHSENINPNELEKIKQKGDLVIPSKQIFFRVLDDGKIYLSSDNKIKVDNIVGTSFAAPLAAVNDYKKRNPWWEEWTKSPFFKQSRAERDGDNAFSI